MPSRATTAATRTTTPSSAAPRAAGQRRSHRRARWPLLPAAARPSTGPTARRATTFSTLEPCSPRRRRSSGASPAMPPRPRRRSLLPVDTKDTSQTAQAFMSSNRNAPATRALVDLSRPPAAPKRRGRGDFNKFYCLERRDPLGELEEDLVRGAHGGLDVQDLDVLPVLLQERGQEVGRQRDVGHDGLLGHADVADGDVQAHDLFHLELDGGLDALNLLRQVVARLHQRGELARLGQARAQQARDLLDQSVGR
mmetsp:Transcript_29568/g.101911  ORF Transcript_29568/g.101911 Transcript_29568/m.101911 type:complete len:253 (+) Transcript_29568:161-919(+)